METKVISQVAQKVLYKNTKIPEELRAVKTDRTPGDLVDISPEAKKALQSVAGKTEFEKSHELNYQRVKELVDKKEYQMPGELVEQIAERIVTNLL